MPAKPLRLILLLALLVVQNAQAEVFRVFGAHDGFPKYFEEDGEAKCVFAPIIYQYSNRIPRSCACQVRQQGLLLNQRDAGPLWR